jgi:acyl-CoA thioester hydrolase
MRIPVGVETTSIHVRVGYVDTDQGGVMHHSTYLRYLEMARVEYLRAHGIDYANFELKQRLALPVVEANLRYKLPTRFDDVLEIKTWVALVNRAKLQFDSVILRGANLTTMASITLCCIHAGDGRICSMPTALLALAPARV